ncbi:MAG: class I SAM-dependent rRNA methyltransferase [Kofleriaceae bacterium]
MSPHEAQRPRLRLLKPLRASLMQGHPWLFDRALGLPAAPPAPGAVAVVEDHDGAIAQVFVDPDSPIRARVLTLDVDERLDDAWAHDRAQAAARRRSRDPALVGCDGLRALHGEADGCPGLVVDVYAGVAVAMFDGRAAAAFWTPRLPAVLRGLVAGGVDLDRTWVKGDRRGAPPYAIGPAPPEVVEIREDDARFGVDVISGQKTGFFLDQRDNRRCVAAHAAGAEVLNLFCYNGGFSLKAGLGGAARVTSVDSAPRAIESLADNLRRTGLPPEAHELVCADAFEFLAQARRQGRTWDLVIADPPSFAPSERTKGTALRGYARLVEACLDVVDAEGRFALASCSSHVTEQDLLGVLASAAIRPSAPGRGAALRVRYAGGAATDHPILPAFPEGRYLKFLLCDL